MSNKELTPIQAMIQHLKTSDKTGVSASHLKIMNAVIEMLERQLPTERTFAEGLFDAGKGYALEGYLNDIHYPAFSTFYKKYEDE